MSQVNGTTGLVDYKELETNILSSIRDHWWGEMVTRLLEASLEGTIYPLKEKKRKKLWGQIFELLTPRDRERTTDSEKKGKQLNLRQKISAAEISGITDKLLPIINEWCSRPLQSIVGFMALVAIAAIGYAIYQHRGEIKEGAVEAGKAVKSFVKDVIDKLPTIQARENNFGKLIGNLTEQGLRANGEERTTLDNKVKIIEMLRNEEQRSAIKGLIEDRIIEEFSEENMTKLVEKGDSTHKEDMEKLQSLMQDFLPKIMAIGNNIEDVEKKVNDKVEAMKPSSELGIPIPTPGPQQLIGEGKEKEWIDTFEERFDVKITIERVARYFLGVFKPDF